MQGTVELGHPGRAGVCELLDARAVWAACAPLVARSGAAAGFVHLCVAGARGVALSLNENCDATVRSDLQHALEHLVPRTAASTADDDAVARAALVGPAVALPFARGALLTGTWQGVYLCDFRTPRAAPVAALATVVPGTPARFHVDPPGRGCHAITAPLAAATAATQAAAGTATSEGTGTEGTEGTALAAVLVRHTSAAVALGAGADARARGAVERALSAAVPERWNREFFEHTYEGPDDMPAHAKSTVVGASAVLPAPTAARLPPACVPLLCEHRDAGGWGGGGRSCAVATSAPRAVQRTVALACTSGDASGDDSGVCAVGSLVRGVLEKEEEAGRPRVLVNVVCAGGEGVVALAAVPRGVEGVGALLARLRAALVQAPGGGARAHDMAAAAATVLGRAVTLPCTALGAAYEIYAVSMAPGPVPACDLVVTVL